MKKIIILLIFISSFLTSFSQFSGGNGTTGDPFKISNFNDLIFLSNNSGFWSANFIQTANIIASYPSNFTPIGNGQQAFMGTYDGGGYCVWKIKIILPNSEYVGIFGYTKSATISNLTVCIRQIEGYNFVGGLVGYAEYTNIDNVNISVCSTDAYILGKKSVGGIVGYMREGSMKLCSSTITILGTYKVGGIIGYVENCYNMMESYSNGLVYDINSDQCTIGGAFGSVTNSVITACYSTGAVYSNGQTSTVGGFVGDANYADFVDSYATGWTKGGICGGFIGKSNNSNFTECYMDKTINGFFGFGSYSGNVPNIISLSTPQFVYLNSFNFVTNFWSISGQTRPYLTNAINSNMSAHVWNKASDSTSLDIHAFPLNTVTSCGVRHMSFPGTSTANISWTHTNYGGNPSSTVQMPVSSTTNEIKFLQPYYRDLYGTHYGDMVVGYVAPSGNRLSGLENEDSLTDADDNSNNISIYPNPCNNYLKIEGKPINTEVDLYDISGKLIMTINYYNQDNIDVSTLKSGTYFIKIDNKYSKFIKR